MKTSVMMTTIIAATVVTAYTLVTAPHIGEQQVQATDKVKIELISTSNEPFDFYPGAETGVNTKVKNAGTEPCNVFVRVSMPEAEGAKVYDYQPGDDWVGIEPNVLYYGTLDPGETTEELFSRMNLHDYGDVSVEQLQAIGEAARGFRVQGYAIMLMKKGTPEQLWDMNTFIPIKRGGGHIVFLTIRRRKFFIFQIFVLRCIRRFRCIIIRMIRNLHHSRKYSSREL